MWKGEGGQRGDQLAFPLARRREGESLNSSHNEDQETQRELNDLLERVKRTGRRGEVQVGAPSWAGALGEGIAITETRNAEEPGQGGRPGMQGRGCEAWKHRHWVESGIHGAGTRRSGPRVVRQVIGEQTRRGVWMRLRPGLPRRAVLNATGNDAAVSNSASGQPTETMPQASWHLVG